MILRGAKVSDGGPFACPNCAGRLRPDLYVDDRVDYWCEHCRRVVAVNSPGWPAPKLEPYVVPPPGADAERSETPENLRWSSPGGKPPRDPDDG